MSWFGDQAISLTERFGFSFARFKILEHSSQGFCVRPAQTQQTFALSVASRKVPGTGRYAHAPPHFE